MNDYGALKAALAAADRVGDPLFMPWGINTLAIYAEKGAPADAELCKKMGGIVIVRAPDMQQSAKDALKRIAAHPAGGAKQFVEMQADWVKTHNVYGARISN
jgi:hypothetical protein